MRRLIRWVLLLAVLGGMGAAIAGPGMAWYRKGSATRYTTAKVSRGRVETVVNSTGTLKPIRTITIGSFVSGPIATINVDFNSRVTVGQPLAQIEDKLLKAALARDEAAIKSQEADKKRIQALLDQAKNNERRARELMAINKEYLAATEFDQVHFTRKSLEAQLDLADAAIDQAKANRENSFANVGYTKIVSPVNGIVIERKVDKGQTVASSFQTPEMFIVGEDMDKEMHVYASVDEADIGLIKAAEKGKRPVRFTVDAYPRDLFEGAIKEVRQNSTTTQNVVTYPVVITTANPDLKLFPGMTANITFLIDVREDVVRVPVAALRFVPPLLKVHPQDRRYLEGTATTPDQSKSGARMSADEKVDLAKGRSRRIVWVQEEEWLRAVPVLLGASDNQFAELIEGDLAEGRRLVTGLDTTAPPTTDLDLGGDEP
jgi:HlyD family secretion protein